MKALSIRPTAAARAAMSGSALVRSLDGAGWVLIRIARPLGARAIGGVAAEEAPPIDAPIPADHWIGRVQRICGSINRLQPADEDIRQLAPLTLVWIYALSSTGRFVAASADPAALNAHLHGRRLLPGLIAYHTMVIALLRQ